MHRDMSEGISACRNNTAICSFDWRKSDASGNCSACNARTV